MRKSPGFKERFITVVLGLSMAFTLVACDDDDSPDPTHAPDTDTTEPIGS